MKVFVDENIPLMTVDELREQGFDVIKIHKRVMQALKKYSEKNWPGLMVVMRDSVQSMWKSHSKNIK